MRNRSLILAVLALAGPDLFAAPPPEAPPTQANISYGPHPHQLLDLYLPTQGTGPFPVLVVYGGIWKSDKHPVGLPNFLAHGCAEVAVETRGMGDATQAKINPPISVVQLDARRSLQFVRLHAKEWNLDPARIAVVGGSQAGIPSLYVACEGEKADPKSADPVEQQSTKVVAAGSWRGPGSIDPKVLLEWDPGDKWGAPSLGYTKFDDSLAHRDELLPFINQWSPDALLTKDAPPIFIEYDWPLIKPANVTDENFRIHSPLLALGFQKLAQQRGATCYVRFPGHPSEKYDNLWDFLIKQLTAAPNPS